MLYGKTKGKRKEKNEMTIKMLKEIEKRNEKRISDWMKEEKAVA